MDKATVGIITSHTLIPWRRIKVGDTWLSKGAGLCPQDSTMLKKHEGEDAKPWLLIKSCDRCGKMWFAGDSLYEYKPEIIQEYTMGLRKLSYASILLPIIMIGFLTAGLVIGVSLTQIQNRLFTKADVGIKSVTMTYLGAGKEQIVIWSSGFVGSLSYKQLGSDEWIFRDTIVGKGQYGVILEGLEENREYVIMVADQEYQFRTK